MEAVTYSGKIEALVDAYNALKSSEKKADYWEHADTSTARTHIKKHYIRIQKYRCCYCRQKTTSANSRQWDTDHIISRSESPAFMFHPQNLAVSCPDCNISKNRKAVSKSKATKRFPASSNSYVIVHPHFDEYEDHILHKKYIYIPKTKKGKKTITACDLLRYSTDFINWDSAEDVVEIEKALDQIIKKKRTVKLAQLLAQIAQE